MATLLQNIRQARLGRRSRKAGADREVASEQTSVPAPTVDIAPNDPLLGYFRIGSLLAGCQYQLSGDYPHL